MNVFPELYQDIYHYHFQKDRSDSLFKPSQSIGKIMIKSPRQKNLPRALTTKNLELV